MNRSLEINEKPQILFYNMKQDDRFRRIRRYLNRSGVSVQIVSAADYLESLGYLAGLPMYTRKGLFNMGGNFADEMLVMIGFTSERMDAFLQFFRDEQLAPVALKAILTPYNAAWNSLQLHEELLKEHTKMNS